jgi:uncharacterized protein (TIGR03118 family)
MAEFRLHVFCTAATACLALAAGSAFAADADDRTAYIRTDLVSNLVTLAQPPDPNLQNAWGGANSPGGPLWVSDNNTGVSTLYDGNGVKQGLTVTIPLPTGRAAPPPAAPTGMVWNPTAGFTITAGMVPRAAPLAGHGGGGGGRAQGPAIFIVDTEDGTISAWTPAVDLIVSGHSTATLVIDNSGAGAVYKGLAFGTNKHGNFLFATNFAAGTVEAYDSNFELTSLDGKFSDPDIPAGFAPFGIHNIDNNLYVTYAKQNAQKNDVVAGPGLGFVNVFTTDGVLIKRFASRGRLNAPWGVARATQNFGVFSGDILIGNFGNQGNFAGWINVFTGGVDNDFVGPLRDVNGKPISIDGLWSIVFGTFLNSDADTLYSTAGPNQQTNGLFGKLVAQPRDDDQHAMK